MERDKAKKRMYLKWPWNLVVYVLLVVLLRIFAIPVILLLMWWNKKQQPDGPAEGYCLQRTRGRLILLVWAAVALLMAAAGAAYLTLSWTVDKTGWDYMEYIKLAAAGLLAVGGLLVAGYLAYTGLRDAFCPEKSQLARSIRQQLPYPEEAPPVNELFAMVDDDLCRNGQWFGRLAVGHEWILGDEVSYIPHIRGVFWRDETRTRRSGNRVTTTRILQLWILDDRQQCRPTDLRQPKELQAALDCLRQRIPAAVFAKYDSREYNDCIHADEQQWYFMEREFERRKEQLGQNAPGSRR
ncbi:hypothetical protein [uncultured Allofournierella sp.]|uniref:hypothetical protein n=1 Tax=uncultured Allofournierella sp. TaxID=1940258 RepID=UPI0025FD4C71|nr:hypothetical protein [uncultured Fournierella sp.]